MNPIDPYHRIKFQKKKTPIVVDSCTSLFHINICKDQVWGMILWFENKVKLTAYCKWTVPWTVSN